MGRTGWGLEFILEYRKRNGKENEKIDGDWACRSWSLGCRFESRVQRLGLRVGVLGRGSAFWLPGLLVRAVVPVGYWVVEKWTRIWD